MARDRGRQAMVHDPRQCGRPSGISFLKRWQVLPPAASNEIVAPMSRYLPRIGGSMLITSRNGDLATQLSGKPDLVLNIDKLEDDDALKLLQNKVSADHSPEADWVALVDALDRLPLAIYP